MRLCVFCGSNFGVDAAFRDAATALGTAIAKQGIGLVYGGGKVGLMGAVADAAMAHGGEVIGIMPRALVEKEIAHNGLSELRVVETMHERKALMADLADGGFIALPGGLGTFEELFEVWTWGQLGYHAKPVCLMNVSGFYDDMIRFLDVVVAQGFVRREHRDMLIIGQEPDDVIRRMRTYLPPRSSKWMKADG